MGRKVKLTITESRCRSGFHRKDDEFIIDEDRTICPPICVELWHYAYPYIWALLNGAEDDRPDFIGSVIFFNVIFTPPT